MNSPFVSSFSAIILSEIGDRTFIIAAILGSKYSRSIAFLSAFSALFLQVVLMCTLGFILPHFFSKQYTEIIACILFFVFGFKMIQEGLQTDSEGEDEELEIVREIDNVHKKISNQKKDDILSKPDLSVVFWQGFMLTFLGEWGDKSQFSTITMSAAGDAFYVFLGASSVYHWKYTKALFVSTLSAVIAGQFISKHISEQKMSLAGGLLFLLFGVTTTVGIYNNMIASPMIAV